MNLSDIDHHLYASLSGARSPDTITQLVKAHLEQGGSANVRVRENGGLYSALGMCCHKMAPDAVNLLLDAGAKPHWPKKTLSTKYLTGSEDDVYEGLNADCLGIAAEMLGGWIVEHEESGALVSDKFENCALIVKALIGAGANPSRPDPAHGKLPLDSLFVQLIEDFDELSTECERAIENIIIEFAHASKTLDLAGEGSWSALPFSDLDWADAYPSLAGRVKARAQVGVLKKDTQQTPRARPSKRL